MSKKKKLSHNHLAEGEATGHFHAAEGAVAVFEREDGVRTFAAPPAGAVVRHQEHGPITLPKGKYASACVREMDHFAQEARKVID